MTGYHHSLLRSSACAIVDALNAGDVTPLDLLDALEARVAEVDSSVNALPTLCFDRARERAKALMARPCGERGLLAGMPIPIKDLTDVAGVRSTFGSLAFKDRIAEQSDLLVEHLESRGGVIYAKSNTPEFGTPAHTDNLVFGPTRNPWDLSRSVSGSSGGAAAALACGTAWLAHGSDSAGSLRNPASFCGVVGMRPSLGRVAHTPAVEVDRNLVAQGPMARNVEDLALLLDAMCGEHTADPRSMPAPATSFLAAVRASRPPRRVAYSADLGITPVDREVAVITSEAAKSFAKAGVAVEEAHPDLSEAHDCFRTLAGVDLAVNLGWIVRDKRYRDLLRPELVQRTEDCLKLTVEDLERAEAQRIAMTRRTLAFFRDYDLLLTPATIVPPFPLDDGGVAQCAGQPLPYRFSWLAVAYAFTVVCCPALSLPCGFTKTGLPIGLQIVAAPRGEAQLLAGARALEDILALRDTTPIDPRPSAVQMRQATAAT
jgi:amidase